MLSGRHLATLACEPTDSRVTVASSTGTQISAMPPRLPTLQPPPDIWGEPVTGAWAGPWPRLATSSLLHGITAFLPSIGASAVLADYFDEQAYQFNGVLASATALFAFALQPAIGRPHPRVAAQ